MPHDIRISNEIGHRGDLALLMNDRDLLGLFAEVGVNRGEFAMQFLHRWRGQAIYLIDNYQPCKDFPGDRAIDQKMATSYLAGYAGRTRWLVENSLVALSSMTDAYLDGIHLDGCHEFEIVCQELEQARRVVKPGGLISCHDYHANNPGVFRAVQQFSAKHGITFWLTQEWFDHWSCYGWLPTL